MSISIHALREEGDPVSDVELRRQNRFLSTPSARRATQRQRDRRGKEAISIHALREEGDSDSQQFQQCRVISIHALREEGDAAQTTFRSLMTAFLSTPSARRATSAAAGHPPGIVISIHALREEGDLLQHQHPERQEHFYPRPPRGGRPPLREKLSAWKSFLSTPSARRATPTA